MSVNIERRIRIRKKCTDDETPSKFSVTLDNIKKQKTDFSCVMDFNSETLSTSSSIRDVSSEKRFRKKKIRSTQDFNNLDSSLTSQDSEKSTKNKSKKTKKRNRVYNLPRISNLTANPQTLDNQKDSDEEIVIKQRRRKKKKLSGSGSSADLDKEKPNAFEKYAKRIKHLLSDSVSRSSKSSNTSNVSTRVSDKKNEETPTNKGMNTKQIRIVTTPKNETSMNYYDNLDKSKKQSVSTRSSRRINSTPHPKTKLSNSSYGDVKEKHTLSVIARRSKTKLSANFLPEEESKNKRRTRNSSHLTVNVSFDMDFDSDDVFNNTFENKIKDQNSESTQQKNDVPLKNNYSIKTRKSVRFQSPEQNIRRETIILSKRSSHNIQLTPKSASKPDECSNDITSPNSFSEQYRSSSGGTKRNSTFDIISPKIITQMDSCQDVSQNEHIINNNTFQKFNTPSKNSEGNTSKRRSKLSMNNAIKRKCSSELLFPINKTRSMSGIEKIGDSLFTNSVIDLTTPTPLKGIQSGVSPSSEKLKNNDVSKSLNKQPTFSKDDEESESTIKCTESTQTEGINISPVPKLVRTATFTKDETVERQVDFQYSPSPSNNSYCKPLDTSKVNKRRRWDKSRASLSFLDNSLDIGNISAPWQENDSFKVLNNSDANLHKQSSESKCNSKTDSPKNVLPKSQTSSPSGTSTPFPKRKSNLLKQALLKDKQDVTANKNKICSVNVEKPLPKVVRTKIPNFALIHQRAFDKLENIKEMSERKAARAKLLLSGCKPPSEDVPKTSTKRKELKFSPVHLKSSSFSENKSVNKSLSQSNISVSKIKKISPSKSNIKVANKENRLAPIVKKKELLKAKSQLPKPKCNTVVAERKGYTRFGFKIGAEDVKKATKDEQVKAVTTKSKIMKNTLEQRRNVIQGVRSNRRFELLMNMRMK